MAKHYECHGDIRGNCGKHHRSLQAAVNCLKRDRAGCRKQGGYSDRYVVDERGVVINDALEDGLYSTLKYSRDCVKACCSHPVSGENTLLETLRKTVSELDTWHQWAMSTQKGYTNSDGWNKTRGIIDLARAAINAH